MPSVRRYFQRWYGAHPLHLLAMLAGFALSGYAATYLFRDQAMRVATWFVGAAVIHDLLLFPLYAIVDGAIVLLWRRQRRSALPAAPWINYLRFPAAISAVLLLVFAPTILRFSRVYESASGLSSQPYFGRWLLITGALFLVSGVLYAVRLRKTRLRGT